MSKHRELIKEDSRGSASRNVAALSLLMLIFVGVVWTIGTSSAASLNLTTVEAAPPRYMTAPGDLPSFEVTSGSGLPGAGYIFLSYFDYETVGRSKAYLLILDNNGEPVYYNRLPGIPITHDFKKQPNGQLTYFVPLAAQQRFYALDQSYRTVATYEAGNGYTTDLHDLQILDNGHALLLIYDRRRVDLTEFGGKADAVVVDCIVQELDQDKNVVFEWNSADHIPITDTIQALDTNEVRYIHCNSVEPDTDGHLFLSNRNLNEITKIDRQSGAIIWRFGGKQSNFKFTNDIGFSVQHDARRIANGNITVYDNGNFNSPRVSRGLEYKLDLIGGKATLVREYRNTPDVWALALGNIQKLDNGNVVVGWGRSSKPFFTEFTEDGELVLKMDALEGTGSYRTFRFPWKGYPTWPPALIGQVKEEVVRLFFSWNGSTETISYQVLGGKDRNNLKHLATIPKNSFESSFDYVAPSHGLWYFQVIPVDNQGQPKTPSQLIPLIVGGDPLYFPMSAAR